MESKEELLINGGVESAMSGTGVEPVDSEETTEGGERLGKTRSEDTST